ncbi:MAG: OsmC family protein [Candidatus Eiseniibacteriota bacterium]
MNKIIQKEQEKVVNGVDVTKLFGTVKAIQENPELAKFNFGAKGRWINGAHNSTTIGDFYGAGQTQVRSQPFVYEMDEHPVLLGEDRGANAGEYALTALNGCLTTALIYHAAAQGIKIDEVETSLSGYVDLQGFLGLGENVRNGYEKINVTFRIKSDAPEEKLKELVELAQKRSPVFDMFTHPTPIKVNMEKKQ